jgi:hypothetical protein
MISIFAQRFSRMRVSQAPAIRSVQGIDEPSTRRHLVIAHISPVAMQLQAA